MNYYDTLKVSPKASNAEIKSAYRRLARKLHPDVNNGSEETARKFAAIAEAYEVLGNPHERASYDQKILIAKFNGSASGDSILSSSNTHARRWRQMIYEQRYNEIIDRMIADERRESVALQRIIFPLVAFFTSTFLVFLLKPRIFETAPIFGKIIIISLFIAGIIHLFGRIREAFLRYTFDESELHDSILDDAERAEKPYSRLTAFAFLTGGLAASILLGMFFGGYIDLTASLNGQLFAKHILAEAVLYPPIFVLMVDLVHIFVSRQR